MNKIAVILTPFHLRQLLRVSDQYKIDLKSTLFFVSEKLGDALLSNISKIEESKIISLPAFDISLKSMISKPVSGFIKHRKIVKKLSQFVDKQSFKDSDIKQLFIGTDKDIFVQLLIKKLNKANGNYTLTAIEEGLGFFTHEKFKHKVVRWIYRIATPLLFGQRIEYFKCLGQHKDIDEVYSRFVNELPNRKPSVRYFEIHPDEKEQNQKDRNKILFLSSPLSEDRHCSAQKEKEILTDLFDVFDQVKTVVHVKPHPRENLNKYKDFDHSHLEMIDSLKSAEEINYGEYLNIIHFGSSVILDIYQSGYPLGDVITLNTEYANQPITNKLYDMGLHLKLFRDDWKPLLLKSLQRHVE